MNDKRSALWRWVIPAGLGVAGFFSLLIGRGGLTADTQVEFLRILCDALFIPGAMLTCVGLLAICAGNGAFDAVTYGVKKLFSLLRGEAGRNGITDISQKQGMLRFLVRDFDMEKVSALYAREEYRGRLRVEAGSKPCLSLKIRAKGRVLDEARAFVRDWGAQKGE